MAASFEDVIRVIVDNPEFIIDITVVNEELTLPVIISEIPILIGVGSNSVTLIAFFVFGTKLNEPVPFANILNIVAKDSLISLNVSDDADANDDVIWSVPNIL